jgi:hypothetical protein
MRVLQHNCRKTTSMVYKLVEMVVVIGFKVVLIQELLEGISVRMSSGAVTIYKLD